MFIILKIVKMEITKDTTNKQLIDEYEIIKKEMQNRDIGTLSINEIIKILDKIREHGFKVVDMKNCPK